MTSSFGWRPERSEGIWRYGAPCLKPFVQAAPWLTVAILLLLFHLIGGTLVTEKGALFDLPAAGLSDGEATSSVALIVPVSHDTLVFFDDSHYMLGDESSMAALSDHLAENLAQSKNRTMLVLADRRIAAGDLMKFATLARQGGVRKVLFAEKKREVDD